jgi:alpha-ketoglutarate-dependent taurine dioxygenase
MREATHPASDLQSIKRRAIKSSADLVKTHYLTEDGQLPVVVEALHESVELAAWAEKNCSLIDNLLGKHGGILFRRFSAEGQESLQKFTSAINMELMNYMEGATPRKALGDNVYTSTEFPPEHRIALHNENSYVMTWPMRICFACVVAPEDRGETPIADVGKVLQRISPEVRRRFDDKGYMLVRNFSEHLGLPWRTSFKVSTREEMESYCKKARIELEWCDEEHLRTRQVRPATAVHPVTHEPIWFNHIAFWHVSSLNKNIQEMLLSAYSEENLPYNTYYGDGTKIEDEVVEELRQAYDAETVTFPWKKGDVLLLDNMLAAHGRSPYSGPRKIIVSMGDPHSRTDM